MNPPGKLLRWLFLVPVTAALIHALWLGPQLVDDAFISFRYAANLANGLGLVFNPGERVEGFSNLLWTLLLSGVARLHMPLPQASLILGVLFLLGAIAVLCDAIYVATGSLLIATTAGLIAAWSNVVVGSSLLGIETPLYMFGLCLCLRGFAGKGPSGNWFLAAGAIIAGTARAEGIVLMPLVLALFVALRRRISLPVLLSPLSLIAVKLWEYSYYGHWLPMSVIAKHDLDVGSLESFMRALPAGTAYLRATLGLAWLVLAAAAVLILVWRARTLLPALPMVVFGFLVAISNKGDWMPFGRLISPYVLLLIGISTAGVGRLFARSFKGEAVSMLVWGLALALLEPRPPYQHHTVDYYPLDEVGRIIARTQPPGERSAVFVLGRIGYAAGATPLDDPLGLTDPVIAQRPKQATVFGKSWWDLTAARKPVLIMDNRWDSVAAVVARSGESYTAVTSPALARSRIFIAIRTTQIDRFAPVFHERMRASAMDFDSGMALWQSAMPLALNGT